MTYSTSSPPALQSQAPGGGGKKKWTYSSTDGAASVDASGYITNAAALGMTVGDFVEVYNTTSNITSGHVVVAINTNGSADLSNGTTVADGTSNSD